MFESFIIFNSNVFPEKSQGFEGKKREVIFKIYSKANEKIINSDERHSMFEVVIE